MKALTLFVIGVIIFTSDNMLIDAKCALFLASSVFIGIWHISSRSAARRKPHTVYVPASARRAAVRRKPRRADTGPFGNSVLTMLPGTMYNPHDFWENDPLIRQFDQMSRERNGYMITGDFIEM